MRRRDYLQHLRVPDRAWVQLQSDVERYTTNRLRDVGHARRSASQEPL